MTDAKSQDSSKSIAADASSPERSDVAPTGPAELASNTGDTVSQAPPAARSAPSAFAIPTSVSKKDFGSPYLYYLIFLFFLANMLQAMDRTILAVLIEPIRRDLQFTDNQIGLLGFAFAVFYALFGLFIGRLADTRSRSLVLSIAVGFFSLATAICGFVQNFIQMFVARVGVGIGEAGSVPTKYSLIGDSFHPEHRASVLALVNAGLGIGATLGLVTAGILADTVGWRTTFVIFGLPGIFLAVCMALTIKEPPRGRFEIRTTENGETPSLKDTLVSLATNRTFVFITLAYSVTMFSLNGIGYWLPSFLVRTHGMTLTEVGLYYGLVSGLSMVAGLVVGAILAPRLLASDRRWEMWLPGIANILVAVSFSVLFATQSLIGALICAGLNSFFLGITVGPASSAIQSTVSARKRGVAVALVMFVSALFAQGIAPWLIGLGSDLAAPTYGEESLRFVLRFSPIILIAGAALYYYGSKSFHGDRVD